MEKAISLYELNSLVKETIESQMPDEYWVEAELSEVHENSGHCYLELIEKDNRSNTPIAKARAMVWKNNWSIIRPYFERITGEPLRAGMKVLLQVYPNFHPAFGFSYVVNDIDPTYTLGDLAKHRQEIIKKLKENGLYELNKELYIPFTPQRIAVISSDTAAGYGDFCKQMETIRYHIWYRTELFPAIMQGEHVEQSIISALNAINERIDDFDVVVIIRGGGGTSDFSGFDTYTLAENVAQFPLPIITGIGHDRDETILDMISNTKVKTPTAAADVIIDKLENAYERLDDAKSRIIQLVQQKIDIEKMKIDKISGLIPTLFTLIKTQQENRIEFMLQRLNNNISKKLIEERHRLELAVTKIEALNPDNLLKRGYSITLFKGRTVKDPRTLHTGDDILTKLDKGTIKSTIK